jgi:hypothetical protein
MLFNVLILAALALPAYPTILLRTHRRQAPAFGPPETIADGLRCKTVTPDGVEIVRHKDYLNS